MTARLRARSTLSLVAFVVTSCHSAPPISPEPISPGASRTLKFAVDRDHPLVVSGLVADRDDHHPLGAALIEIGAQHVAVVSNAAGEFSTRSLPAGRYLLRVRAIGYASRTDSAEVTAVSGMRVLFALRKDLVDRMQYVVAPDMPSPYGFQQSHPSAYGCYTWKPGSPPRVLPPARRAVTPSGPNPIGLVALDPDHPLAISGVATDQRDEPLKRARVAVDNRTVPVDSEGKFERQRLSPGIHVVTVGAPGYETRVDTFDVGGGRGLRVRLPLATDDYGGSIDCISFPPERAQASRSPEWRPANSKVSGIVAWSSIVATPAPQRSSPRSAAIMAPDGAIPLAVAGVVTNMKQEPLVGANITIDSRWISIGSDRAGVFQTKAVPPGRYLVRVRAIGYKPWTDSVSVTADAGARLVVSLTEDVNRLNADGFYGVSAEPPPYSAFDERASYSHERPPYNCRNPGRSALVGRMLIDTLFPGTVSGVVTTRGNDPIEDATIQIVGSARSAIANSAGRFAIRGVPSGRLIVLTTALGFDARMDTVDVQPNRGVRLRLPLAEPLAPTLKACNSR